MASGITTSVTYPGGKLQLSGTPTNLSGATGLFTQADLGNTLNIGLVSFAEFASGNFARATFQCRPTSNAPLASEFGCIADGSDSFGNSIPASCTASLG